MIKSTLPGNPEGHFQSIPSPRSGRFEDHPRPVYSPLELHVRRLRYFMDLLESGYRYALLSDPLPFSQRPRGSRSVSICPSSTRPAVVGEAR